MYLFHIWLSYLKGKRKGRETEELIESYDNEET